MYVGWSPPSPPSPRPRFPPFGLLSPYPRSKIGKSRASTAAEANFKTEPLPRRFGLTAKHQKAVRAASASAAPPPPSCSALVGRVPPRPAASSRVSPLAVGSPAGRPAAASPCRLCSALGAGWPRPAAGALRAVASRWLARLPLCSWALAAACVAAAVRCRVLAGRVSPLARCVLLLPVGLLASRLLPAPPCRLGLPLRWLAASRRWRAARCGCPLAALLVASRALGLASAFLRAFAAACAACRWCFAWPLPAASRRWRAGRCCCGLAVPLAAPLPFGPPSPWGANDALRPATLRFVP